MGTMPCESRFFFISLSCRILLMAAFSVSTTPCGVPRGASRMLHEVSTMPAAGSASRKVGVPGIAGWRFSPVVTMALSLPALICTSRLAAAEQVKSTVPESVAALASDPRFTVAVGSTEGETLLAINNARPPFNDVRVRRALAHAIDRDALNKAFFANKAELMYIDKMPKSKPYFNPEWEKNFKSE